MIKYHKAGHSLNEKKDIVHNGYKYKKVNPMIIKYGVTMFQRKSGNTTITYKERNYGMLHHYAFIQINNVVNKEGIEIWNM